MRLPQNRRKHNQHFQSPFFVINIKPTIYIINLVFSSLKNQKKESHRPKRTTSILLLSENKRLTEAAVKACNFIKKRPQDRCFPVNIAKFLRASFFTEHLRWLLLDSQTFKISNCKKLCPPVCMVWVQFASSMFFVPCDNWKA